MKRYYYLFVCCLFLISCYSQKKGGEELKISLKFYPGGIIDDEDFRYSILVLNDSLNVIYYSPMSAKIPFEEYKKKLTKKQVQRLDNLTSAIKNEHIHDQPSALGIWGVTLRIDNEVYYENNDFSFENPPKHIKKLIKYLVNLSDGKIDLYGFA